MALTDSLRILITANGAQAEREFAKVGAAARKNLGQAEAATVRMGRRLTSAGVAMATFGGVALVGMFKAAQAAEQEEQAIARLNTAFANSPVAVGESTDALIAQAAALQDTTKFADDATIGMQAILATFRLTSDEIMQLTPLVQDLASFWGMDLESAAKAVGKALQGNIGALQRQGIIINEAAYEANRFDAVMAALRENAGGFAEQEGRTLSGQLTILKNNLGDIAESLGRGAIQGFNTLLGPVQALGDGFQRLNPGTQQAVGMFATFGAAGLTAAGAVSFLTGQVLTAASRFKELRAAITVSRLAALGWVGLAASVGFALGRITDEGTGPLIDDLETAARLDFQRLRELAEHLARVGEWGGDDRIHDTIVALGQIDAMQAQRLADYLMDAGVASEVINQALIEVLRTGNFENATGELAELRDATEDTTRSVRNLGQEWNGLQGALGNLDAEVAAGEALYSFRDALREANRNGRIGAREMLNLRGNLGDLVGAYQRAAEASATASDGTVNYRARNRQLRESLGALAAFIPAQLRPEFRNLTRDVLAVPDSANINVTSNVTSTLTAFQQLPAAIRAAASAADAAQSNAHAPGNLPRSIGGQGKGPAPRGGAPRVGRRRRDRVQPVLIVGGLN